jgi:hypothetical protein
MITIYHFNQEIMKTFRQLQDEAARKSPLDTYKKINDWAAKQYAKQWIQRVAEKATMEMTPGGVKWIDTTSILNVKMEIDAH